MAGLAAALTCKVAAQDTNCAECWAGVTQWHGTWNLTLKGSSVNNSSQGTFDISNGVSTVTGSASVSGNLPGCCTCSGSGALDSSSTIEIVLNTSNCTYSIILNDRLSFDTVVPVIGTIPGIETCSGETVAPVDSQIPSAVIPYFPLPAYGDSLVENSGSFTAPLAQVGCYDGEAVTLTISWEIEPIVPTDPPKFTHIPTGGSLGCNPTNTPTVGDVLDNTDATAPNGEIVSVSCNLVNVTNGCTVTSSFNLTATDECTQKQATALVVYSWTQDTNSPVISGLPGGDLGCNPANPPTDASVLALITVTDDCSVASTNITHADTTNGCSVTRTFTITAADDCGNVSPPAKAIYTWTMDKTLPVITGVPAGASLGCNPNTLPSDASVSALVQATDNCGIAKKNVSHVDVTDGCTVTRTFTITAADNCGNVSAPSTVKYTWTSDTEPPVFTLVPPGGDLGTNPPCIPGAGAAQAQSQATDNCGISNVTVTYVDSGASNQFTREFTIVATDFCGNSAMATVDYSWSGTAGVSLTEPILNIQTLGNNVLLYWPTDADCFCLITGTNLTSGIWTGVTNVPAVSGSRFMVTNNASGPGQFYRLVK